MKEARKKWEKETETTDSPLVIAFPPRIYLGGVALGLIFCYKHPLAFLKSDLSLPVGLSLIVISIALVWISIQFFIQAHTNVDVY